MNGRIVPSAANDRRSWRSRQATYWNTIAPQYDQLYDRRWFRLEESQVVHEIASLPMTQPRIAALDLGCGTGLGSTLTAAALGDRLDTYSGVDISEGMIARAKSTYPTSRFVCEDAMSFLQSSDERWDLVIAVFTTASYLSPNPKQTVQEAASHLTPGGWLYLSFLARPPFSRQANPVIEYHTRGEGAQRYGAPARRLTRRELLMLGYAAGLEKLHVTSLGPLVGRCTWPALFPLNIALRRLPFVHTITLIGRKAE